MIKLHIGGYMPVQMYFKMVHSIEYKSYAKVRQ